MADTARAPLVMGDAFRDAWPVLVQRGLTLLLLSVALVFTGGAGAAWLRFHPPLHGAGFVVAAVNWLAGWLALATPHSLFIAAASWTAAQILEGRSPSNGETLSQGLRFFAPLLAIQLLSLLGIMVGAILLVVPGIIVALMWMFASPALIVERLGVIDSLKRSRALTKGHRWALLGLVVVYSLVVVAIEWVIFRVTAPGMSFVQAASAPINAYGVVPLVTAMTAPLNCAVMTAIYMRLRLGHRGSADQTAEVFA
jgi:hypothetical protein